MKAWITLKRAWQRLIGPVRVLHEHYHTHDHLEHKEVGIKGSSYRPATDWEREQMLAMSAKSDLAAARAGQHHRDGVIRADHNMRENALRYPKWQPNGWQAQSLTTIPEYQRNGILPPGSFQRWMAKLWRP